MGYSKTPKYRIEIDEQSPNIGLKITHQMSWEGRASDKRLEEYVMRYAKSLEHGGVNYQISKGLGYIPYPVRARIVEQKTRRLVAAWEAGAFQVFHINPVGHVALSPKDYRSVVREVRKYVPRIRIMIDDWDIFEMLEPGTQAAFCEQDQTIITREPEYYRSKKMLRHVLFHELAHWAARPKRGGRVTKFTVRMLKRKARKNSKKILNTLNHALEEMIVDAVSYHFCVKSGHAYNAKTHEQYIHTWAKRGGIHAIWNKDLEQYYDKKVKSLISYITNYRKNNE